MLGCLCFWPALISKGLRRPGGVEQTDALRFLACPDFKGIKTKRWVVSDLLDRFWPALISKGLRRLQRGYFSVSVCFWPALISKGLRRLQYHTVLGAKGFWPALISKGLRHSMLFIELFSFSFWPALISKGLRREIRSAPDRTLWFLACPDFKGIKTFCVAGNAPPIIVSGLP